MTHANDNVRPRPFVLPLSTLPLDVLLDEVHDLLAFEERADALGDLAVERSLVPHLLLLDTAVGHVPFDGHTGQLCVALDQPIVQVLLVHGHVQLHIAVSHCGQCDNKPRHRRLRRFQADCTAHNRKAGGTPTTWWHWKYSIIIQLLTTRTHREYDVFMMYANDGSISHQRDIIQPSFIA